MARIPLAKAGSTYKRFARGINAAGIRELNPVMEETARDVVTKHFVSGGPDKKPLKTKIVSRSGALAGSVGALPTKLTRRGIEAGIKMAGVQARGLEEGATISHPGNVGKLQVFKVKGSRRPIFTRKTRAHLISIRKRAPLKKTMRRWRKRHLEALNRGVGRAATSVGLKAKVS
jgi:hypothetical protein